MDYLDNLNESQRRAVELLDGPMLVLAGAGSGKTRMLTCRVAHVVKTRNTRDILAVTFTNKAAGEMAARVQQLLGVQSSGLWALTFHSLGNRILRREMDKLGRPMEFVIFDDSDQKGLIKECLRELNLDPTTWTPQYIAGTIDVCKNSLKTPADFAETAWGPREKGAARVYELYEKKLKSMGAVDFADLLSLPLELFEKNPDVLARYRERFRYIMVDEYQDTNQAQYRLIKLLAGKDGNVCVVGDEDQSIYRWRGADITNILNFQKDFPTAGVVKLEENYRSVAIILKAAERVISSNTQRIGKKLIPIRQGGHRIIKFVADDEREEADFVCEQISKLIGGRHKALDEAGIVDPIKSSDIAVFYRTHAQSRALEDSFRARNMNYIVVGGVKFYDRREVKDILAYLRLLVNPRDDISFLRVVNVPARKIGDTTIGRLRDNALQAGVSMMEAAGLRLVSAESGITLSSQLSSPMKADKTKALSQFVSLIESFQSDAATGFVSRLIDRIIAESGYRKMLKEDKSIEAVGRLENLDELIRAAEEYEESAESPSASDFLDKVSLRASLDDAVDGSGSVTLMTLHNSKGLEFRAVFMVGLENNIFPHMLSAGDSNAMEEERRLCYVGMTRARDLLFMTRARVRRLRGEEKYNLESEFLSDVPEELTVEYGGGGPPRPIQYSVASRPAPTLFAQPAEVPANSPYKPGQRVKHRLFGLGIVEGVEGEGEKLKVRVFFHQAGHKTLLAKYAGLEPA